MNGRCGTTCHVACLVSHVMHLYIVAKAVCHWVTSRDSASLVGMLLVVCPPLHVCGGGRPNCIAHYDGELLVLAVAVTPALFWSRGTTA